jgi:hypothetical protein
MVACGAGGEDTETPLEPANGVNVCEVTLSGASIETQTTEYGFDTQHGRLTTRIYVFDIDEAARTVAVSGNEASGVSWYWTNSFDEHGRISRLEHRDGTRLDYTNSYEGDRLTQVELVPSGPGQGYVRTRERYFYEDPNTTLWTRLEYDRGADGSIDEAWVRTMEAGATKRAEYRISAMNELRAVWTHSNEGGKLISIERDQGYWQGADGAADIRFSWKYASDGQLESFEQDGTDSLDDPHIDGVPDYSERYSRGCPQPGEVLPTFRAPPIWPMP